MALSSSCLEGPLRPFFGVCVCKLVHEAEAAADQAWGVASGQHV